MQRAIRALLFLCRSIPFLRGGEDEASQRWREKAFEKCVWILKNGGSVFVYPEAGRSRNGWFEARRPKDFLGRLALAAPQAEFLCVYLRGEGQLYATAFPAKGESFRMYAEMIPAVLDGKATPRAVSQRLFNALSALQLRWFAESSHPKNCGGNDVLDLKSPALAEHCDPGTGEPDPEWVERHLTPREKEYLAKTSRPYLTFCKFLAAKEAAAKALAQSGIKVPSGGFATLEADLFRRRVTHLATGCQVEIAFTDEDQDKVHCLAVLRGGSLGDEQNPGDVVWRIEEVPPGVSPSEFARERCLELIAESSDDIPSPAVLAFSDEEGIPKVLRGGKACDWGVSLSHSGRYAAYSFMVS